MNVVHLLIPINIYMKILDVILKENHEVREGAFRKLFTGAVSAEAKEFMDNYVKQYVEYATGKQAKGLGPEAYDNFDVWFTKQRMKDVDLQKSKYALDPEIREEMAKQAEKEMKAVAKGATKSVDPKSGYWINKFESWTTYLQSMLTPGKIIKTLWTIGVIAEPVATTFVPIIGGYSKGEDTINAWFKLGITKPDWDAQLAAAGIKPGDQAAIDNFRRQGKMKKSSDADMYKWIQDAELQNTRMAKAQIAASLETITLASIAAVLLGGTGYTLTRMFGAKFAAGTAKVIAGLTAVQTQYVIWKIHTAGADHISTLIFERLKKNGDYPWSDFLGASWDAALENEDQALTALSKLLDSIVKSMKTEPSTPIDKFQKDYEEKNKITKKEADPVAGADTTSTTGEEPTTNTPQPEQNPDQYSSTTSPSAATDKKYGEPGYVSKDGLFTLLYGDNDKGYAWKYNKLPNKFTHTEPGQEPDPKSIR